jgi:integrase-like protein
VVGKTRAPMVGKNIWRLCKMYRRIIGYPELKPHDLRHGVAMKLLEQHHDLEQGRALLGHARIDTTQVYTSIRPTQLKRAVSFYEEKALQMLSERGCGPIPGLRTFEFLKRGAKNGNAIRMVAPTGFEPVFSVRHALR